MKKRKVNVTTFPLRLNEDERKDLEVLHKNFYNASAYLRYCLKKKADEFRKEGHDERY